MYKITIPLLLVISILKLPAQCPTLTASDMDSPGCTAGTTPCDICVDDILTFTAEGDNLPNGGCVNWYYSTNPAFNPYAGQGTLMGCGDITSTTSNPCDQCPEIQAIFINACGTETDNEFFVFSSGSGFNTSNLSVGYPNPGPGPDANVPACPVKVPSVTITGCPGVVYVGPGQSVPPGVPVVFFVSSAASTVYNMSATCSGGPIYVMQSSCTRTVAAFLNTGAPGSMRTLTVGLNCGCSESLTYDAGQTTNTDGDFVNADLTYGNSGCVGPAVNIPAPPPNMSTVDPFDFTATANLCNGGPFYVKGRLTPAPGGGCPQVLTATFQFNVLCPTANVIGDDVICEGETAVLTASGGVNFSWSTGETSPSINVSPSTSTNYSVTVSSGNCEDETTFSVDVTPDEIPNLGTDQVCQFDDPYDLTNLNDPSFPDGNWSGPGVSNDEFDPNGLSGSVILTFTPDDECVAVTTTTIEVDLPQQPFLSSENICQTADPYPLSALADPSYPNGTWSGPGVTNDFFDPSGLAGDVPLFFDAMDYCVEDASTSIFVIEPEIVNLLQADICNDGGLFDLNLLNDPVYPRGIWSGPRVNASEQFDPTGQAGTFVFNFSPDATECALPGSTNLYVLQAGTPKLGVDSICADTFEYDLMQLIDTLYPTGTWVGQNVANNSLNLRGLLGTIALKFEPDENCIDTVSTTVFIYPNSVPKLKADTICQNSGLYALDSLAEKIFRPGYWFGDSVYNNQFDPSKLSGVVPVTFVSDSACAAPITTFIRVQTTLLISNLTFTCDPMNQFYTVQFHISGGDTMRYTVSGGGVLNGNDFISDPIRNSDPYFFIVEDGGTCAPQILSGRYNCGCGTSAGSMRVPAMTPLEFCVNDSATAQHNLDHTLSTGDTLQFILHTLSGSPIGTVLDTSFDPNFAYNAATMTIGTVYYISAIAGAKDPLGNVTMTDTCLSVAQGIPVVFRMIPSLVFAGDQTICAGDTANLQLSFFGKPDFQFQIAENGTTGALIRTNQALIDWQVQPVATTTYELIVFRDAVCDGVLNDSTVTVSVSQPPVLQAVDTIIFGNDMYSLVFSANGGDFSNYQFTGTPGGWDGSNFTTIPVPCGNSVNVCLTDGICSDICLNSTVNCSIAANCTTFAGTMGTTALTHICVGDTISLPHSGENLDANDALEFILHTYSGDSIGTILYRGSTNQLQFQPPTQLEVVYYFSAVAGNRLANGQVDLSDTCTSVAIGTPVIFHQAPTATFGPDVEICKNEIAPIEINFTGTPPYDYIMSINGLRLPLRQSSSATTRLNIVFIVSSTIVIEQVTSGQCTVFKTDTMRVRVIDTIGIQNFRYECDTVANTYQVVFEVFGGESNTWRVTGLGGNLVGNLFTSNPIRDGRSYSFNVFDQARCDTFMMSGAHICGCQTSAGTLRALPTRPGTPFVLCGTQEVTVVQNLPPVLDNNDTLLYVLHDSPGPGLGNILAANPTGEFSFVAGMQYDQVYYISAVAGNGIATGVDLRDPCLSISAGNAVIFYPAPAANFSLDPEFCGGDCTYLNFNFIGIAPFTVNYTYTINGTPTNDRLTANNNIGRDSICPGLGTNQVDVRLVSVESNGCMVNLNLPQQISTATLPASGLFERTVCENDSLILHGVKLDRNNPTDTIILQNASVKGCDSLIYAKLNFVQTIVSNLDTTLCPGGFFVLNGTRYDASRTSGMEILQSSAGCDSLVNVNLRFFTPISALLRDTLCYEGSLVINGSTYDRNNPSGQEILLARNGCDSTVVVDLFFKPVPQGQFRDTLCFEGSLVINGRTYNRTNPTGQETVQTANGCDSLVLVDLFFKPVPQGQFRDTLCFEGSLVINGRTYNRTNPTGQETVQTANGCDSLVLVDLFFKPVPQGQFRDTLCFEGSLVINGRTYNRTNPTGQETVQTAAGCDSLVLINLFFKPVPQGQFRDTLCPGERRQIGGTWFDENNPSGAVQFKTPDGCDSIVQVNLAFRSAITVSMTGPTGICLGDSVIVQFNLAGAAGANIRLTDNFGGIFTLSNVSDGSTVELRPSQTTTYTISSVVIPGVTCTANIGGDLTVRVSNLNDLATLSDFGGFNVSCFGENDGFAEITVSGGETPYDIRWADGNTNSRRDNLPAGRYDYEVQDNFGCKLTGVVSLTEPTEIEPAVSIIEPACAGAQTGSLIVENISGGTAPYTYSIDGVTFSLIGNLPVTIPNLATGNYELLIKDANDCQTESNFFIPEPAQIEVNLPADTIIGLGDSLFINAVSNLFPFKVEWEPANILNCDSCLQVVARPLVTTVLRITVFDASGCTDFDEMKISVNADRPIYIPTGFSPNDDGFNDIFTIFGGNGAVRINKFLVFDRWGNLLYQGVNLPLNDVNIGWDGKYKSKKMDPGVYVFFAEIEFLDGEKEVFKGDLTLTR